MKYSISDKRRSNLSYLSFIAPSMIIILFVFAFPIIKNILLSFQNSRFLEKSSYVGFKNYVKLFNDPLFWNSVGVLLEYTVIYTIAILIVGLLTALLLTKNLGSTKSAFRTVFVLPYAIPDVVAAMVFLWMLDYQFGIINHLLQVCHIVHDPVAWLSSSKQLALCTIITIEVWRQFPLHTLMIFAALQDVPQELYEASELDGASKVRQFFSVSLPYISQVLVILLTLTVIWCLRRFTMIWLLTQGGPNHGTETIAIQIYTYAFQFSKLSYSSAISTVLLIMTSLFLIIYMKLQKTEIGR